MIEFWYVYKEYSGGPHHQHPTLFPTPCQFCGIIREPKWYWGALHEQWWYYDHYYPQDCIKYLRSLIDDIGSRRIV